MWIAVVAGLLLSAVGLAQLLLPDLWWRMHAWSKRVDGVQAERTDEWDTWRGCGGVFLVLFGLVVSGYGCSQAGKRESPERAPYVPPPFQEIHIDEDVPPETREAIRESLEEPAKQDR